MNVSPIIHPSHLGILLLNSHQLIFKHIWGLSTLQNGTK